MNRFIFLRPAPPIVVSSHIAPKVTCGQQSPALNTRDLVIFPLMVTYEKNTIQIAYTDFDTSSDANANKHLPRFKNSHPHPRPPRNLHPLPNTISRPTIPPPRNRRPGSDGDVPFLYRTGTRRGLRAFRSRLHPFRPLWKAFVRQTRSQSVALAWDCRIRGRYGHGRPSFGIGAGSLGEGEMEVEKRISAFPYSIAIVALRYDALAA